MQRRHGEELDSQRHRYQEQLRLNKQVHHQARSRLLLRDARLPDKRSKRHLSLGGAPLGMPHLVQELQHAVREAERLVGLEEQAEQLRARAHALERRIEGQRQAHAQEVEELRRQLSEAQAKGAGESTGVEATAAPGDHPEVSGMHLEVRALQPAYPMGIAGIQSGFVSWDAYLGVVPPPSPGAPPVTEHARSICRPARKA